MIGDIKKFIKVLLLIYSSGNREVVLRDILSIKQKILTNEEHLRSAMEWLCRAQDVTSCNGVAGFYSIEKNEWGTAYPETTGYIIPTFLEYYRLTKNKEFRDRAIRMAEWESKVQLENGAIQSGTIKEKRIAPAVFNTGQVVFGWIEAYNETKNAEFLKSAIKAGNWLCDVQDIDGSWKKGQSSLVLNSINTYNVRTAWALASLYVLTQDKKYFTAALKNGNWTLTQQKENGWFYNNDFSDNKQPLLHTIAYAIEGLLETGMCLNEERFIAMAARAADALISKQLEHGLLYGRYNENWMPVVRYCCLTGIAQMGVIWLKLFKHNKQEKYISAAECANNYLKSTQNLSIKDINIRGGIKGSQPIWGGYEIWLYLNWAAKFFADSLILEEKLRRFFE